MRRLQSLLAGLPGGKLHHDGDSVENRAKAHAESGTQTRVRERIALSTARFRNGTVVTAARDTTQAPTS